MRVSLRGLYLILDANLVGIDAMGDVVRLAATEGVRLFQFRDKYSSPLESYRRASRIREVIGEVGGLLVVNDRCDLALAVEADGVHLGQADLPLPEARRLLGPQRIIGISTHSGPEICEAASQGADYLGFGPVFPTATKSDHEPVLGLQGVHRIRGLTNRPIFAIGGITPDAVSPLREAGADGVAMASKILCAPDAAQAIREVVAAFSREDPSPKAGLPRE